MAPTIITSTPVVTQDAQGNTVTTWTTTLVQAAVSVPVQPSQPSTQPSQPPVTGSLLSAVGLGKNAPMNGFLPLCTPEFNTDISKFPVDTAATKAFLQQYTDGGPDRIHFDNTMPYSVINGGATVKLTSIQYADESDNVPVPLTAVTPTEGNGMIGALVNGKKINANGDHHTLVLDKSSGKLYELYQTKIDTTKTPPAFSAASLTVWDATKTTRRPAGYTSGDAAGLAILPLLIKYDEAASGEIKHAFRFTMNQQSGQIRFPATHTPNPNGGGTAHPGMVLRMKPTTDISKCDPIVQTICRAMMKYGMYCADQGGNMYVSATDDPRWNTDVMGQLGNFTENDFEVIDTSSFKP